MSFPPFQVPLGHAAVAVGGGERDGGGGGGQQHLAPRAQLALRPLPLGADAVDHLLVAGAGVAVLPCGGQGRNSIEKIWHKCWLKKRL